MSGITPDIFYLATVISASAYLPILQYENSFTAAAYYVFIVYSCPAT